jgi:hypothetical protein
MRYGWRDRFVPQRNVAAMGVLRIVFWVFAAVICGAFGFAIGLGLGLPEPVRWMFGLWFAWGILFAVFVDGPLMRWLAKTLFGGEIDPHRRPIKGRIVAYERGIIRFKDDTSTLQWKTCFLTLTHFIWRVVVNLFMVLVVLRQLATWLAEQI